MAFDGITIAGLVHELQQTIEGGRISKIAQPEKDELLFTIKTYKNNIRLLVSASASLPLMYLTEENKPSPMTAPNFCMLLRKHIGNAKILKVSQPGLERIIELTLEHLDELGDICKKRLIIELMGKHSNIIFCRDDNTIIDSIKHISAQVSSVREVLPGRNWFIPQTTEKLNPLSVTEDEFIGTIRSMPAKTGKTLYQKLTGISPVMGEEICTLASIDSDLPANTLSDTELYHLYHTFQGVMEEIAEKRFSPNIVYLALSPEESEWEPAEFSALPLTCLSGGNYQVRTFSSISRVLENYYASKNRFTRIRQKSSDLRRIVQTALERNYKKYDLQEKQLKDTEKREKYKIYGELLNTYGYELTGGEKQLTCTNYYTGQEITIPLDPQLTARENSQKFFDKYNKLKRTFEALT